MPLYGDRIGDRFGKPQLHGTVPGVGCPGVGFFFGKQKKRSRSGPQYTGPKKELVTYRHSQRQTKGGGYTGNPQVRPRDPVEHSVDYIKQRNTHTRSRSIAHNRLSLSFVSVFGSLRIPECCLAQFFQENNAIFFVHIFGSAHTGSGRGCCGFPRFGQHV